MLPTDSPMPRYPSIMFASSLEAAATEMRRLFLSLKSLRTNKGVIRPAKAERRVAVLLNLEKPDLWRRI